EEYGRRWEREKNAAGDAFALPPMAAPSKGNKPELMSDEELRAAINARAAEAPNQVTVGDMLLLRELWSREAKAAQAQLQSPVSKVSLPPDAPEGADAYAAVLRGGGALRVREVPGLATSPR